jgi:hypothetical protein
LLITGHWPLITVSYAIEDGIVKYEIASPDRIIDVYTTMGRATLITIPEGDVSFVAIGDDAAYSEEHLPDNNYVIVRPREEGGATNLTIFSTKKGVRYRTRLLYTDKLDSYYNELIILPSSSLEKFISFASIVTYLEKGEAPDEINGDTMFWKPGTVLNGKSASLRIDTVFHFKSPKITGLKLSINNLTDRSIYPVNGSFRLYRGDGVVIKTLGFRVPYVLKAGAVDSIYVIAKELIEKDLRIRVGISGLGIEEYAVNNLIANTSTSKEVNKEEVIHLYEKKEGKL